MNEKMNKNEEMQAIDEESLQSVAGGNKGATMSEEDSKKIDELILDRNIIISTRRADRFMHGPFIPLEKPPAKREKSRLEIIGDELEAFAKKYPDDPRLKEYRKEGKIWAIKAKIWGR